MSIEIEQKNNYLEKFSKYVADGTISEDEVNNKIQNIKNIILRIETESNKSEKNKLKKQLTSGEEDIKLLSGKKYTIIYFYNKNNNKIILKDIVEYAKEKKRVFWWLDAVLSFYVMSQLWYINGIHSSTVLLFFLSLTLLILNVITVVSYTRNKSDMYNIVGKDWLDKVLLDLYDFEKVYYFRISRTIQFSLLILIYASLFSTAGICWILTTVNLFSYFIIICMFVSNIFELTNFNFFYFIGIIIIAILGGGLQSTNWEALVVVIAIISLLFSDDIWKISLDYDNPLEGKYKSKKNKEIVERNVFKYKITLSVISLVLFIILKLLGDNILVGKLILGDEFDKLNAITTLLYKGLDRFLIAFILVFSYFGLKKSDRVKEFEKPILDRLIQFVYKDLKLALPIVKTDITIDEDLKEIFEPKTLIENLDDLPDDIIVSIKKPIKNGNNILFIQYSDGSQTLKENVNIIIEDRNKPTRSVSGYLPEYTIESSNISNKDESNTLLVQNVDNKQSLNKEIKRYLRYKARLRPRSRFKN